MSIDRVAHDGVHVVRVIEILPVSIQKSVQQNDSVFPGITGIAVVERDHIIGVIVLHVQQRIRGVDVRILGDQILIHLDPVVRLLRQNACDPDMIDDLLRLRQFDAQREKSLFHNGLRLDLRNVRVDVCIADQCGSGAATG